MKRPDRTHPHRRENCREAAFTCRVCGQTVLPQECGGQHRNHCPHCLSSVHLDNLPGDRAAHCEGVMDPVSIWVRSGGEWAIIHRCRRCGAFHSNRVAADDSPLKLMQLAVRPLACPPFPLEYLAGMSQTFPPQGGPPPF